MSNVKKLTVKGGLPKHLNHLSDAPDTLYMLGEQQLFKRITIAVVGTRKPTEYGRHVTHQLISSLRGREVAIVSGLAIGTDSLAHQAAIETELPTIAVLPCGIKTVYPRSNRGLCQQIITQGGAVLSEYDGQSMPMKHTFIARNRIIAGLADAVLIPEAALKSGSLHTANFALDLGIPVLAVPGPITSPLSEGTNQLIRSGAVPILKATDIYDVLGLSISAKQTKITFTSVEEEKVYTELLGKSQDLLELSSATKLPVSSLQQTLSLMEINGEATCITGVWSLK